MSDHDHEGLGLSDDPSRTSQVRTQTVMAMQAGIAAAGESSSLGVNKQQMLMIVGLVATIAGSVYGVMQRQINDERDDSAAIVLRLETHFSATILRNDLAHATEITRVGLAHEERVIDLKTIQTRLSGALESCLEIP